MTQNLMSAIIDEVTRTVTNQQAMMTQLDQATGDGDHGFNMAKGFGEIGIQRLSISNLRPAEALKKIAVILQADSDEASRLLFGSFFLGMAAAIPDELMSIEAVDLNQLSAMLDAGVKAVKEDGNADVGDKTMLDVLIPVAETLRSLSASATQRQVGDRLIATSAHGLHKTSTMQAKQGRAVFLGHGSFGQLDPGAFSTAMLISAVIAAIDKHRAA